jgi:hypothetical protein
MANTAREAGDVCETPCIGVMFRFRLTCRAPSAFFASALLVQLSSVSLWSPNTIHYITTDTVTSKPNAI